MAFLDIRPYDIVLFFLRIIANIFLREIRPRGAFNIPREGPVLFAVAPHHNQLLDPLLIFSEIKKETGRRVAFLIASKSLKIGWIRWAALWMESIPVFRAADAAVNGSGKARLHPTDHLVLLGTGTKFLTQVKPKSTIMFGKPLGFASAEIEEVVSDTEIKLKREFSIEKNDGSDTSANGTARIREHLESLEGDAGLTYKILPRIDQTAMYGSVYARLTEGGCIGLFPEGGSHDRTDLLPLKAGVTIMALGAMQADPKLRVKIVPVGLSYFSAHKFRSRAVVEFGAPIDVPLELVAEFGKGGKEKRAACGQLLEVIYEGLKTVTVRTPDYDTLVVIQAGRRLYRSPGQHPTLGQTVELNRRFIEGYLHYQHEPRVVKLREHIITYNRKLRNLGLRDHQVERATRAGWRSLGLLFYRLGLLLAWSILALPGVVSHAPIFIPAKIWSHRKAKEALAASTVKIAGRDVLATWKITYAAGLTPLLYTIYAVLATVLSIRWGAPLHVTCWMPVYVFVGLPFTALSALKFGEAAMDIIKSLPPLVVSLIPGNEKQLENLRKRRARLEEELAGVINTFGPEVFENFNESRLLPAANVPPSSHSVANSNVLASEGGNNILSHPMNWIDDKIFGWSKAGSGSTELGDGGSEDGESDYDHVLGILHTQNGSNVRPASPTGRSRSYADLQSLKESESALKDDEDAKEDAGLYHRRVRKQSMECAIPVGEIGNYVGTSPKLAFRDLTEEVNEAHKSD
ncbi:glycerol-3-phosphate O-acyltransferase [Mrakia frigida]|uniref:glycerol-3-phosphate O-acyltransferase n=1 Tax=Mrakia frigida TaxID=29902 RepID=UPI003FCBF531